MKQHCFISQFFAGAVLAIQLLTVPTTNAAKVKATPFTPGRLRWGMYPFSPQQDGCPLFSTMYFPLKAGVYTPVFFLGGFYDFVSTDYYSGFLKDLTKHGYIVVGIDLYRQPNYGKNVTKAQSAKQEEGDNLKFQPGSVKESHMRQYVRERDTFPEFLEQMKWLQGRIDNLTLAVPDWSKLTLSCQSAGCDILFSIVREHPSYAAAAMFIDPVSFGSVAMDPKPVDTMVMSYISQLSFFFPTCCIEGMSYKRIYELVITKVKVRMSVEGYGHCDLMDGQEWEVCYQTGICPCAKKKTIAKYKQFTAGMLHAFVRWTVFKEEHMQRFVTDQEFMPLKLNDLGFDVQSINRTNVS